jgi:hypothetical protein
MRERAARLRERIAIMLDGMTDDELKDLLEVTSGELADRAIRQRTSKVPAAQ